MRVLTNGLQASGFYNLFCVQLSHHVTTEHKFQKPVACIPSIIYINIVSHNIMARLVNKKEKVQTIQN